MFCCLFLYLLKTNISNEQPASNETGNKAGRIKKTKHNTTKQKIPGSINIAIFLAISISVQVQRTLLYVQNI